MVPDPPAPEPAATAIVRTMRDELALAKAAGKSLDIKF